VRRVEDGEVDSIGDAFRDVETEIVATVHSGTEPDVLSTTDELLLRDIRRVVRRRRVWSWSPIAAPARSRRADGAMPEDGLDVVGPEVAVIVGDRDIKNNIAARANVVSRARSGGTAIQRNNGIVDVVGGEAVDVGRRQAGIVDHQGERIARKCRQGDRVEGGVKRVELQVDSADGYTANKTGGMRQHFAVRVCPADERFSGVDHQ